MVQYCASNREEKNRKTQATSASDATLIKMANLSEPSIQWEQLKGAYGSAREVGELLGLIESGENVWGDLIREVLHQSSLYEATAPVVSWVIAILKQGRLASRSASVRKAVRPYHEPSQKAWAFVFLAGAAHAVHQGEKNVAEPGYRLRIAAVVEALRAGSVPYEKGLSDREPEVRIASAAILKTVAADRAAAFASVVKCYEGETEIEVRVAMLSALNALAPEGELWNDRLLAICNAASSDLEKFYSAAYLKLRRGPATPEDISNRLPKLHAKLAEPEYPVELTSLEDPDELLALLP
jgi:hypothetical protein